MVTKGPVRRTALQTKTYIITDVKLYFRFVTPQKTLEETMIQEQQNTKWPLLFLDRHSNEKVSMLKLINLILRKLILVENLIAASKKPVDPGSLFHRLVVVQGNLVLLEWFQPHKRNVLLL